MTRIGDLRTRALIQRPVQTSDGQGGSTTVYSTADAIWINLRPLRGQELLANQRHVGIVTFEVTMRANITIDATMRLMVGGLVYQITSPPMDPDGKRQWQKVNCEAIQ